MLDFRVQYVQDESEGWHHGRQCKLLAVFICQNGNKDEGLSPASNSLRLHVQQVTYQDYVWQKALEAAQVLSSPEGNGWYITNDLLCPVLMPKAPASRGLVELTSCK